jgi:hypothetical protein
MARRATLNRLGCPNQGATGGDHRGGHRCGYRQNRP